jgi:hypothetical protein
MHKDYVSRLYWTIIVNRDCNHLSVAVRCLMVFLGGTDVEFGITEFLYVIVPPLTNWFDDEAVW